jgi:hypothetical protein
MRYALVAMTALALAGCDSGEVPNPAQADRSPSPAAVEDNVVDLRVDGIAAGSEAFYFAAGRSEVEAALARTLGAAMNSGTNAECGAGPVDFTDFPGGLAVHFQQGRLIGWNWRLPQDGDVRPQGTVRLSGGDVQLGSARSVAAATAGFARIDASTLGEEFSLGPSIGGFIENDAVSMLYAGTQCFMR